MNEGARTIEVTRTYLQLETAEQLRSAFITDPKLRIEQLQECTPSFYQYLYREVGRYYHWIDRLEWDDEKTRAHLAQPAISLFVMYASGVPAGYFELSREDDGSIEVAYFGLMPEFLGRGMGKHLLSVAVSQAWNEGARRVWLHTCSLDDPAALPNYLKRGFAPFKQETYFTTIAPDEPLVVALPDATGALSVEPE